MIRPIAKNAITTVAPLVTMDSPAQVTEVCTACSRVGPFDPFLPITGHEEDGVVRAHPHQHHEQHRHDGGY